MIIYAMKSKKDRVRYLKCAILGKRSKLRNTFHGSQSYRQEKIANMLS